MTSRSNLVTPVAPVTWMNVTVSCRGDKAGCDSRSGFARIQDPTPKVPEPSGRRSMSSMRDKITQKAFRSS